MSEVQNIVIIGASVAGHALANSLAPLLPNTHRILLIDASDTAYWPIAALRASVKEGWEERVVAPLNTATVFAKGTAHKVIAPNKVVQLKESSVVLEKEWEGKTEIPFFRCVIATGSLQPSPMRPQLGALRDEIVSTLKKNQREIAASNKVLIIGGGPVGLEVAGEIREAYPSKSITIVHSDTQLLNPTSNPNSSSTKDHWSSPSSHPKLSVALQKELDALKIETILGDRVQIPSNATAATGNEWDGTFGAQESTKIVTLSSGKKVEADYVFVGVGNKPNGGFVGDLDEGAVQGGMIKVDRYFKVKSDKLKNYFAIGDVSTSPGWKTAQTAQADAEFAAQNVIADIKSTSPKSFSRSTMHALVIPLGATRGAGALTLPLVGTVLMPLFMIKSAKSADLFVKGLFQARFKGAEKVVLPEIRA